MCTKHMAPSTQDMEDKMHDESFQGKLTSMMEGYVLQLSSLLYKSEMQIIQSVKYVPSFELINNGTWRSLPIVS